MLSLKDLSYLVALEELGHFGKAAEASYVSQPTLSGQLKKLERQLGMKLIERVSKKIMLTHVGLEIAQRAKVMVLQAHEMEEFARAAKAPLTGRLRLAIKLGAYQVSLYCQLTQGDCDIKVDDAIAVKTR